MLASFLERWGYLAVALGTMLEGEGTLLAAGALAHKGLFAFPGVWLAAFVGTLAADQLWFALGRRYGTSFVARRPEVAQRSRQLASFLERYGALFVTFLRFLFGLRMASLLWLGSSGFSYGRFLVLDILGAALWTTVIGTLGWGVGATVARVLGRSGYAHELLIGGALLAALACAGKHALKRRTRPAHSEPRRAG